MEGYHSYYRAAEMRRCCFAHVGYGECEVETVGETEEETSGVESAVGSGGDLEGYCYYADCAGDPETDSTACSGTHGVNTECCD